jgi:transcriptional regulator with XRE-family HTH domain
MNINTNSLGNKIRFFRIRSGVTQLGLELEIGASNGSLCRIERDQVNPTKETIIKIAHALKLTREETQSLFDI